MIRLLGAITGSALALAALLVLIGMPQFRAEPKNFERAVVTLPYPATAVEEMPAVPAAPADVDSAPDRSEAPGEMPAPLAGRAAETPPGPEVAYEEPEPAGNAEPDWYAFWSPFRSELAASGFVEQLQRVTGLDYRVVKVKTGVYEVAFAYDDDDDISHYLSQITAATGLNVAEQ